MQAKFDQLAEQHRAQIMKGDRGERGLPGPRGMFGVPSRRGPQGRRGRKGERGSEITAWQINRANYSARPMMSDGTWGATLNLYDLFSQYQLETSVG
jgi:hypothetical protein